MHCIYSVWNYVYIVENKISFYRSIHREFLHKLYWTVRTTPLLNYWIVDSAAGYVWPPVRSWSLLIQDELETTTRVETRLPSNYAATIQPERAREVARRHPRPVRRFTAVQLAGWRATAEGRLDWLSGRTDRATSGRTHRLSAAVTHSRLRPGARRPMTLNYNHATARHAVDWTRRGPRPAQPAACIRRQSMR